MPDAAVTAEKLHRPEAVAIARAFVDALGDTYEHLVVAGSLRRRLAYVKDIEIVVSPKLVAVTSDLLGERHVEHDLLDARMADLLDAGEVEKRLDRNGTPRWGPKLKLCTFRGAPVDLFVCEPGQFGWRLMVWTGPAAFSRQLVLDRGRKTKDGRPGLKPAHIRCADGWLTWSSGEKIPTPTERAAFAALSLPYVEPWERE